VKKLIGKAEETENLFIVALLILTLSRLCRENLLATPHAAGLRNRVRETEQGIERNTGISQHGARSLPRWAAGSFSLSFAPCPSQLALAFSYRRKSTKMLLIQEASDAWFPDLNRSMFIYAN
jgi:hypothetical protein